MLQLKKNRHKAAPCVSIVMCLLFTFYLFMSNIYVSYWGQKNIISSEGKLVGVNEYNKFNTDRENKYTQTTNRYNDKKKKYFDTLKVDDTRSREKLKKIKDLKQGDQNKFTVENTNILRHRHKITVAQNKLPRDQTKIAMVNHEKQDDQKKISRNYKVKNKRLSLTGMTSQINSTQRKPWHYRKFTQDIDDSSNHAMKSQKKLGRNTCLQEATDKNMTLWNFLPNYKNPCFMVNTTVKHKKISKIFCIPYFFVAGFPKCGTTDLFHRMSLHPQFVPPPFKEPHWLTRFRFYRLHKGKLINSSFINNLERGFFIYSDLFRKVIKDPASLEYNARITGDFSPSTIWDSDAYRFLGINKGMSTPLYISADFVADMNPCAKMVILMRDPVQRLYSDYLHFHQGTLVSPEDFHHKVNRTIQRFTDCFSKHKLRECLHNYMLEQNGVRLRVGVYYAYIEDWFLRFERSHFLFIKFEDHITNITQSMKKIFNFLDMEKANSTLLREISLKSPINTRADAQRREKNTRPMLKQTEEILKQFYQPFNKKLAELLGDPRYLWSYDVF